MESLLVQERAAEQDVRQCLNPDYSIDSLLQTLSSYRELCEACAWADIASAESHELRLWAVHTDARKYLHRVLSSFRRSGPEKAVATRQVMKGYLKFIKQTQTFYRSYIQKLNARFGGISELQQIAHAVQELKRDPVAADFEVETRRSIVQSCHRTLIYLGDLSRYRASEKLDKAPDFGPAVGYYQLACTMWPASGMGHHQLAVVALEQRKHFRAVFHLYRAVVAKEPHPLAAKNLKIELDKINTAWDRGTLIHKGPPNDPDAPKRTVCGWFMRLHGLCFPGEVVRDYEELELQLLTHVVAFLRHESSSSVFVQMTVVNMAAQTYSGDGFQRDPTAEHQQAFIYCFRFNIYMLATLADAFYDSLTAKDVLTGFEVDGDLASRLEEPARRLLPSLRMYSLWLVSTVHLIVGLTSEDFLAAVIHKLWTAYARMLDVIAAMFPIWDLEDAPEVEYLLEEDVDCAEFRPLVHEQSTKTWFDAATGQPKPRFSDAGVTRVSQDDEMLARVRDILTYGLQLATDSDASPIALRGTRVVYGEEFELPSALVNARRRIATASPKDPGPQILKSYAAAAAGAAAVPVLTPRHAVEVMESRQAQLSQMVDDLVEDDGLSDPVTPPQIHLPVPRAPLGQKMEPPASDSSASAPGQRSMSPLMSTTYAARLQSVSSLWHQVTESEAVPALTAPVKRQLPAGDSPARTPGRGHSRGDSASSIRSRTSQHAGFVWPAKPATTAFGINLPQATTHPAHSSGL